MCISVCVCVLNEVHKQIYGQQHSIIKCFNKRTRLQQQQQQLAWVCTKSGCHAMRRRSTKRRQRLKYVYAYVCVCVWRRQTHTHQQIKIFVYCLGGGACSCVAHVLAARWSQRWRERERERWRDRERDGQSVSKRERTGKLRTAGALLLSQKAAPAAIYTHTHTHAYTHTRVCTYVVCMYAQSSSSRRCCACEANEQTKC